MDEKEEAITIKKEDTTKFVIPQEIANLLGIRETKLQNVKLSLSEIDEIDSRVIQTLAKKNFDFENKIKELIKENNELKILKSKKD